MASCAVFKAMLVQIYFNTLTTNDIIENRFDEISVLSEAEEKYIDKLICHIGRWRGSRTDTHDAVGVIMDPAVLGS